MFIGTLSKLVKVILLPLQYNIYNKSIISYIMLFKTGSILYNYDVSLFL